MSLFLIRDAPILVQVSGIGTDSGVEYSPHTCETRPGTTTPIAVVHVRAYDNLVKRVFVLQ